MKTNATRFEVLTALETVNKTYGYSLSFDTDVYKGKYFHFTLKTPSKVPGSRTSHSGRNLPKASWHAHGYLFDELFKINPFAIVWSAGNKITAESGNWQDQNIGSRMSPIMYSQTSIL